MTIACQIYTVQPPATHITATSMVITPGSPCAEPCDATVTITWTNTGRSGTFEPAIIVDSVRTGSGKTITVPRNGTYNEVFNLTALAEADYNICPDPN